MKYAAILLLSCLALCAQSPLITGSGIDWTLASSASSVDFVTNQGIPRFYWNWQDLTNGVTVSNQWLDRIQSVHLWQMNTSIAPTNSAANGVRFQGGQQLTNAAIAWGVGNPAATGTTYMVYTFENPASFPSPAGDSSGANTWFMDNNSKIEYNSTILGAALPSSAYVDVAFIHNGGNVTCYTNGSLSVSSVNATGPIIGTTVGHSGGDVLKGWVNIWLMYSNNLGAGAISNLHWWRTNPPPLGLGLGGPP